MCTTNHRSLKSGIYLKVFVDIPVEYHSTYPSAKIYRDWGSVKRAGNIESVYSVLILLANCLALFALPGPIAMVARSQSL